MPNNSPIQPKGYVITGPTAGIGQATALEVAKHGTLILVARDRAKVTELKAAIEQQGGHALPIVCDLSDIASARRAAADIAALGLPIACLVNNAGIFPRHPEKSVQGWDLTFATNHLGPFTFTESLISHLPDGANVVFVVSNVEDPDGPARMTGFRGGRYISAEASARGEWLPGGSANAGYDAYATSKQANLAAVIELAREVPRLHFKAFNPGLIPQTTLGRDGSQVSRFIAQNIIAPLAPVLKGVSTSKRAARILTKIMTDTSGVTGVYYDDSGKPATASAQVRDPAFTGRVVAETRALLAAVPS